VLKNVRARVPECETVAALLGQEFEERRDDEQKQQAWVLRAKSPLLANSAAFVEYVRTPKESTHASYASQDAAIANAVVENLEKHGIKCWIAPRDVTPGSQYADDIVGAINGTKVLVLVLSEHAVASPHVGREIERAASKQRRIIGLRTDAAPLTSSATTSPALVG